MTIAAVLIHENTCCGCSSWVYGGTFPSVEEAEAAGAKWAQDTGNDGSDAIRLWRVVTQPNPDPDPYEAT